MLLVMLLMMRLLFGFFLKLNSHHHYRFTSSLQQTLKQNHYASHNCYRVKNILKLLAFRWLLNESLLETKWSEVMLTWWSVSIKFIVYFLKPFFLTGLFKLLPCNFNFIGKTVPFPYTDIVMVASLFCFSSAFFLRKVSSSFFFFPFF